MKKDSLLFLQLIPKALSGKKTNNFFNIRCRLRFKLEESMGNGIVTCRVDCKNVKSTMLFLIGKRKTELFNQIDQKKDSSLLKYNTNSCQSNCQLPNLTRKFIYDLKYRCVLFFVHYFVGHTYSYVYFKNCSFKKILGTEDLLC